MAAAKLGLSTLVKSSADAASKVQFIIGILDDDFPNSAELGRELGELLGVVQQHKSLAHASFTDVSSVLDELLASVIGLTADSADIVDLRAQVQQLQNDVQSLNVRLAKVEGQLAVEQHKALLGQLAYLIDQGAASFVYGPGYCYYTSFRDLEVDMRLGGGTPEELERWRELCAFFRSKGGLSPRDVTRLTSIVRQLGCETAHGSGAAKASTKLEQLHDWARQLLQPQSMCAFQNLVDLATCFSSQEQPLVPAQYSDVQKRVRASLPEPQG